MAGGGGLISTYHSDQFEVLDVIVAYHLDVVSSAYDPRT